MWDTSQHIFGVCGWAVTKFQNIDPAPPPVVLDGGSKVVDCEGYYRPGAVGKRGGEG